MRGVARQAFARPSATVAGPPRGHVATLALTILVVTTILMVAGVVSVPTALAAPLTQESSGLTASLAAPASTAAASTAPASAAPVSAAPSGPVGPVTLSAASSSDPVLGEVAAFWAVDEGTGGTIHLQAAARYVGENCVIYVDQQSPINQTVLNNLGAAFDSTIYPKLTSVLGQPPIPGIDGSSKITILIYDFDDQTMQGFFRWQDIDPPPLPNDAHSNYREMVYLNSVAVGSDPDTGPAVAAHELAHLIVYYHDYMLDPSPGRTMEAAWVNEGIACYAEHLAGYDGLTNTYLLSFSSDPGTDLISDFSPGKDSFSNYGAAYSFISYLVAQEGQGFLTALVAEPADGITGVNAALRASGIFDETFDSLLDDWVIAGFLGARPPRVDQYSFPELSVSATPLSQTGQYPLIGTESVTNFGAVYLDFPSTSPASSFSAVIDGDDGAPLRAAIISWDSTGVSAPDVRWFAIAPTTASGTLTAPAGYDRHTLVVLARGDPGAYVSYDFRFNGAVDPPAGVQFLDLPGDDPIYPDVADLVTRHVIGGMESPVGSGLLFWSGGTNVKRAQFAKMIMEATGLHTEAIDHLGKPSFKDVTLTSLPAGGPNPYPYDYVEEAAAAGIVNGFKDGRFGPYQTITRGQLIQMIVRGAAAAGKPFPTYTGHDTVFADVTPTSSLYKVVMQAYHAGIFQGSTGPDGRQYFYPGSSATRNHVAKMTYNLVHYLETSGS